jgi:hypothetical protein
MYLFSAVIANLVVARFGPAAVVPVGFLAIGFDLTARDALHEEWHGKALFVKMATLIFLGSLIAFLLNRQSLSVAVASFVSFAVAGGTDTLVYEVLYSRKKMTKVNLSNLASAAVDSLAFPTLAFGAFLPWTVLGQFVAKALGGAAWSLVLKHTIWRSHDIRDKA